MRRKNHRRTGRQKQPWQVLEKHQGVHHGWSKALEENKVRQGQKNNMCVEGQVIQGLGAILRLVNDESSEKVTRGQPARMAEFPDSGDRADLYILCSCGEWQGTDLRNMPRDISLHGSQRP